MGYIYCITNTVNGKQYVGKTSTSLEQRFAEHRRKYKYPSLQSVPLYRAMTKYGLDLFKFEELEVVEDPLLSDREIYWISKLNTFGKNGYNATKGGDGSTLYDYAEIALLASQGFSKKYICEHLGCSLPFLEKLCKAKNIKIINKRAKLIGQFDLDGNLLRMFSGAARAMQWLIDNNIVITIPKKLSKSGSCINSCCKGKQITAYGFKWKYFDEPIISEGIEILF